MNSKNRILLLSPHTDDGEIGCGGSIAKFVREGKEVRHVVFSDGRPVINPAVLLSEFEKSNKALGIPPEKWTIEEFEIRSFEKDRQAILDKMIFIERDFKPDLIFLPCSKDVHQDHAVISREGLRAFKSSTILGYEEPWNNIIFETSCFIILSEEDLFRKWEALKCYESQKNRYYFSEEIIRSLALVRGTQIKTQYAESFEVIRWIVR